MVDDHGHVTLLDLATELATEFVGAKFDDRVILLSRYVRN
jgi:hypothetical protein